MVILAVLACASTGEPPVVDQRAWLAALIEHRPELVTLPAGSRGDPAWHALVLRPRYRDAFLASDDTYETLLAREYTADQRASDAAWVQSLRAARSAFVPTANLTAGYGGRAYVGYQVGPWDGYDTDSLVYKAFFELRDFQHALSAERYAGFVERLDALGFRGDSKIDLRPGRVRFLYNDLIVHAPSIAMARCAEAAGIAFFGTDLVHVARGLDVMVDGRPVDWHHFLLTGRYDRLPTGAKDFVEYRIPMATLADCPHASR
jgi:hypothetical protein